jgi:hypothetical protein
MPLADGENFIYEMAIQGFVFLDEDKNTVVVTDKLFEYLSNWRGKRDYDVIQFISRVEKGYNAQINLINNQMQIAGIGMIAVSDSQQVSLYPNGGLIAVNEDMDFKFDGLINAGLFSFWGSNHEFKYDQFMVDMPKIDSMRFKVKQARDTTWILINPFVSSALAIFTVCSSICCITNGPRLNGGNTAELSPE